MKTSNCLGLGRKNQEKLGGGGGLSPPRKKLKQKPKKSFGVEPLNWQSFIEIGDMA